MANISAHFVLPVFGRGEGAAYELEICDANGKITHHISANAVLTMMREVEQYRVVLKSTVDALERERQKIRRLMAAMGDEITQ
jgi:hypothetical protein